MIGTMSASPDGRSDQTGEPGSTANGFAISTVFSSGCEGQGRTEGGQHSHDGGDDEHELDGPPPATTWKPPGGEHDHQHEDQQERRAAGPRP